MAASKVEYLNQIYFDSSHPAAFGGIDKLYKFVKEHRPNISKEFIRKWLSGQEIYVKHKSLKFNFRRRRVIVPTKYYQFDVDTMSMIRFSDSNDGYKYVLVVIDILSRFAWTHALKTLTAKEMVQALKKTLTKFPKKLRSDGGSEFINSSVKKLLTSVGTEHFQTLNEKKANFAERLIKT